MSNNSVTYNRAVAYCRYSSDNQRDESIEAQERAIREYCDKNDLLLIDTYVDRALSATSDNRPEFLQMIEDSGKGVFDTIIVHKLDRFSRDRYDSAIYKRKLKRNGIELRSVLENLDNSPESVILESVLDGMSEYYSRNLSREVRKGHQENALKCKHNGGRPALGYDVDEDGYYVINEVEAEAVRMIYEMYLKGHGYGTIRKRLKSKGYKTKLGNDFGKNSLYDILGNERYTGTYIFSDGKDIRQKYRRRVDTVNVIKIENGMPAIISKEQFEEVKKMREENRRSSARYKNRDYLLSGILYCSCGAKMYGDLRKSRGNDYFYYRCEKARFKECSSKSVDVEELDSKIIDMCNQILFTKENQETIVDGLYKYLNQSNKSDTEAMNKELKEVELKIDNIINAIASGVLSMTLKETLQTLERQKEHIEAMIRESKLQGQNISKDSIRLLLQKYKDLGTYPIVEGREILKRYVHKIIIDNGNVNVHLKTYIDNDSCCGTVWRTHSEAGRTHNVIICSLVA